MVDSSMSNGSRLPSASTTSRRSTSTDTTGAHSRRFSSTYGRIRSNSSPVPPTRGYLNVALGPHDTSSRSSTTLPSTRSIGGVETRSPIHSLFIMHGGCAQTLKLYGIMKCFAMPAPNTP